MEVNIKHDELAAAKQLVPDSTDGNCFIPNKIDCIACRFFFIRLLRGRSNRAA
jgi:hypothetical protein